MNNVNQSFLLTQAKTESKRLLKFAGAQSGVVNITKLTEAQALVAILKGKASWRELALNAKNAKNANVTMQAETKISRLECPPNILDELQQEESIKITIINLDGESQTTGFVWCPGVLNHLHKDLWRAISAKKTDTCYGSIHFGGIIGNTPYCFYRSFGSDEECRGVVWIKFNQTTDKIKNLGVFIEYKSALALYQEIYKLSAQISTYSRAILVFDERSLAITPDSLEDIAHLAYPYLLEDEWKHC